MPSRMTPASTSGAASPTTERMDHEEAHRLLMKLWASKPVGAATAGSEMEQAMRLREVEALSVAMTALEVVS